MIKLDDLFYYPVAKDHTSVFKETYTFIAGDQNDPHARVVKMTFYKDVRSVKFEDVTDLYKEDES